jgi:hypothetical protein
LKLDAKLAFPMPDTRVKLQSVHILVAILINRPRNA